MGDVCHCIPLIRALQAGYPNAEITWIIGKTEFRLVGDMPGVEFIVFDKKSGVAGRRALRQQLSGRVFDVLLLAQTSLRSSWLSRLISARRKIGYDYSRSREGHYLFVNERIRPVANQHEADASLEFARVLGINADLAAIDRSPPIQAQDREFARQHQPEADHAVLISPCSSHAARNWLVARYAAVADWIIEHADRPVILVGGPSDLERTTAQAIESSMQHRPTNLVGQDTLGQALAMFERAACLIAPDSGPVHFAAALNTPVVGLYASTWSLRSGPFGSLEHCVDRYAQAAQQFYNRSPEQLRWGKRIERPGVMALVEVDAVIAKLKPILLQG